MNTRHALPVCCLLASGCVTTSAYNKKVDELTQLRAADAKAAADQQRALEEKSNERLKELEGRRAALEAQLADRDQQIAALTAEREGLRKQVDDTTALAGELKKRLEKLGQNVDKLTSEKGQLASTLDEAKARLEDLRKQKAAAEARAATFRTLVERLRSMIDSGALKVTIRDGRMLLQLPNDVLFDSGKTELKPDGQKALAQVATVLAGIPDRHFLIAGHTDNVPIHTKEFASNWELSTARAVRVTRLLIEKGMKPQLLAAAGHGEFDPVAANDTSEHKAQNRRIEIVLEPNLADLPPLDNVAAPKGH